MRNSGVSFGAAQAVEKLPYYYESIVNDNEQVQGVLVGDETDTVGLEQGQIVFHDSTDGLLHPYTGAALTADQTLVGALTYPILPDYRYTTDKAGVKTAFNKPVSVDSKAGIVKSQLVGLDAAAETALKGRTVLVQPNSAPGGEVFYFDSEFTG